MQLWQIYHPLMSEPDIAVHFNKQVKSHISFFYNKLLTIRIVTCWPLISPSYIISTRLDWLPIVNDDVCIRAQGLLPQVKWCINTVRVQKAERRRCTLRTMSMSIFIKILVLKGLIFKYRKLIWLILFISTVFIVILLLFEGSFAVLESCMWRLWEQHQVHHKHWRSRIEHCV